MEFLLKHSAAMFDVSGGTIFLIMFIGGTATMLIRNHLASVFSLIIVFPLILLCSFAINYMCLLGGMYDVKKMADWMIWTIMASTAGTFTGIGIVAATAWAYDREEAAQAAR
jgi:hypothetical protein